MKDRPHNKPSGNKLYRAEHTEAVENGGFYGDDIFISIL